MVPVGFGGVTKEEVTVMKGMYSFLSRGFACLAVALVIVSVLAMPTQGLRANDPSPDGGNHTSCFCAYLEGSCDENRCDGPAEDNCGGGCAGYDDCLC